jgi:hypothetical protein
MTLGRRQVRYDELLARINRFRVVDVLVRCNAMADWVDSVPLGEARVGGTVVTPWALAFIAKTSLLRSTDNRQQELSDQEFARLLSMQDSLEDAFVQKADADPEGFLIRTAWQQFPLQEAKNRMIPRTLMLLKDANEALGRTPIDVEAAWMEMTGLTLEEFLITGFAYSAGVTSYNRVTRHIGGSGVFKDKVSIQQCEAFLRLASATYGQFRELSAAYRIPDPLYAKTEFNVLTQRPLIAREDELISPVPNLLPHRATDGMRYDLREHFKAEHRNPFSEYFGQLFQHYTGVLLKSAFAPTQVYGEPAYGRPEKRGPDWVIIDGSTALLFECRTSGLMLESKTIADRQQVVADLKRILIDTARKYPQKIDDLQSGITGINVDGVTEFVPIIVTYEPAYLEPLLRSLSSEELDERAKGYRHIDVGDLETLARWHGKYRMSDIIGAWDVNYRSNPRELGLFLNDWAKERNLDFRNELLEQRMTRFTEEQLGIPYPPERTDGGAAPVE